MTACTPDARARKLSRITAALVACGLAACLGAANAQSRIQNMPGYENWQAMAPKIPEAAKTGRISPDWADNSRSFTYRLNGETWRYDVRRGTHTVINEGGQAKDKDADGDEDTEVSSPTPTLVLARGRGADANVLSPDGKLRAVSRDMNLYVAKANGDDEEAITTDGGPETRIRNGVGSYVYLEEFGTRSPVWWSPDSRKVAWMRYDESEVKDYILALDQTKTFTTAHVQAYPHPGEPNPVADLMVHDLDTGRTTRMDVRDGADFASGTVGHYVWDAIWTERGDEILVRRADRLQKVYDLAACSVRSGSCRTVVRETRPGSWAEGDDPFFLEDGERFIWASERNGFRNFYLYDLRGRLLAPLTQHEFEVVDLVGVDETRGEVWYTARSGDNYMKAQLHRVSLEGKGDVRLTDPSLHHSITMSPNQRYFVDVAEAHNKPPVSTLYERDGEKISDIVLSDLTEFQDLGLNLSEIFTFTSADGVTPLFGQIVYPSDFDPARKYPTLVSVYGGPSSTAVSERFRSPDAIAEFGFVILRISARTESGRGREILDTVYQQLGVAEVDDIAVGVRSLQDRSWFDKNRVGVFGTSYGGTTAALLLMRYPGLFQAAVSNSPVTDWELYDSAYTERYLGLPADNPQAYRQGSVLQQVENLSGDLMLYFGTSDDNVHPKNAMQLIAALNRAGKSYDVQVGPDRGHTSLSRTRMMEFFIEKLVISPSRRD